MSDANIQKVNDVMKTYREIIVEYMIFLQTLANEQSTPKSLRKFCAVQLHKNNERIDTCNGIAASLKSSIPTTEPQG